ncbi:hypothetical protein BD769DRAFT_1771859 [Suillus cothurnatus]|nr:hypothetical protein BD769DRAFT_1771859 [Suillus cothurnatus]
MLNFTEPRSLNGATIVPRYTSKRIFPSAIPSGTAVPNWAYLNVTAAGFDAVAAQNDGVLRGATTGSSTTSSTNSKNSNVGATAGGVVSGIAGAAVVISLATWYFVKCRRSPTTSFSDIGGGPGYTESYYSPNPNSFPMQPQMMQQTTSLRMFLVILWFSFLPAVPITSSSNMYQHPSIPPDVFSQQPRPGQYAGAPEV